MKLGLMSEQINMRIKADCNKRRENNTTYHLGGERKEEEESKSRES